MDFSKWRPKILHEIEYLFFHNYFFFGKKDFNFWNVLKFLWKFWTFKKKNIIILKFYDHFEILWHFRNLEIFWNFMTIWENKVFFRNSRFPVRSVFRSDQFSLLMYRCLLPLSVTIKMDYKENNEKCSLCKKWWNSFKEFMNQRLNHLVFLYEKCNCIRMLFILHTKIC